MPASPQITVRFIVCVTDPPAGVAFAVQKGRSELLPSNTKQDGSMWFAFEMLLGPGLPDSSPNFLGQFAQGPKDDRFVYINSGASAGQAGCCWQRRAKLKLSGIPRSFVEEAINRSDRAIQAVVVGTGPDGGPTCATVKPAFVTWSLVETA
jgi:hypothetical protein